MKIFNSQYQNKLVNLLVTAFMLVTFTYLIFFYLDNNNHSKHVISIFYALEVFASLFILILRRKINLQTRVYFLSIILIISGLLENYFFENYKGYFFCLLAILISSFILRQRIVFTFWGIIILSLIFISILKSVNIQENINPESLSSIARINIFEKLLIFSTFSFLIAWALTSFKNYSFTLIDQSSQENLKYKPLFDQTYSFITLLDNKGKVIESNQAALYYIQKTNKDIVNTPFQDSNWWNHSFEAKNKITKNLEASINGDFRRFEITHQNSDGEEEFFDYTLKPIFDNDYNVKFIIAEGRNITDIKTAKQALIEGEERLVALTESTYEGIIISNAGIIIEANKSAMKLFQFNNLNDIIGLNIIENFIHSDDHAMVKEKIKENFTKPYEVRAIRKDGTEIPIEIEGRDIIYKGKLHRVSAVRDLTERRLAQKALISSEEKYRLITENINDIICKLDEKLKFTFASSSIYNMLGYTVTEIEKITLRDITTRESFAKIVSKINNKKKLLLTNSPEVWTGVSFESILKHKNGKLLWTHINAKLIKWGKNNTYEILCVARNIDVIKKFQFSLEENEQRLKQQNEEYERLNNELTNLNEKLLLAKLKAEESDDLKSAFLSNMSHEIRTPMNSIIGFSRMFKNVDIDDEKRLKYADFVINNGKDLLSIVNDILDLSKIESGQIQLKKTVFNLNELIEDLYIKTGEKNNKGLMIIRTKELEDGRSNVFADKNRLMQVLNNLLNNAYKFTKKGAVKFGYSILNDKILFYVEDTGIGISMDHQDKVFERFRQVEMQASRVFGGAGLGLSISKKLIELMNGKIWLKSEVGSGSTFYISIPYEEAFSEKNIQKQIEKTPNITPEKTIKSILIAEDDESNFFYLSELLSELNYNIIRAKNGLEAVDICTKDNSIMMVFMDIKMPIMDGFEATKRIKELNPNLPIIAQTAFAMADDQDTALKNGCDDYMSKPIDPETLFNKIAKYSPN